MTADSKRALTIAQQSIMREDLMWDPLAWEGMQKIANIFIASGAVPSSIQNVSQMLMILQAGREVGAKPVEAMRTIALVKGKITMEGRLLIRKMHEAGVKIEYIERTAQGAKMKFQYKDRPDYITESNVNTITSQQKSSSTFQQYGRDMYVWKCVQDAAKFYVPDVITAMDVREVVEAEDIQSTPAQIVKERATAAIESAKAVDVETKPAEAKGTVKVREGKVETDIPAGHEPVTRYDVLHGLSKKELQSKAIALGIRDDGKKDVLVRRIMKHENEAADGAADSKSTSEAPAPTIVEAKPSAKATYEDICVALDNAGSMEDLEPIKRMINTTTLTGEEGKALNEFFADKMLSFRGKPEVAPTPKDEGEEASVLQDLFAARQ